MASAFSYEMIADLEQFELIHVSRLGLKGQVLRRALRQHFTAIIGDRNRVLPLRGQATVSCGYGPAITRIELRVAFSRIHHGFDGKRHSFSRAPCQSLLGRSEVLEALHGKLALFHGRNTL